MEPTIQTAWFKARMRKLRITQDDLGAVLKCDRSVVSRILNGRQELALSQVVLLADALDVSPFEVLKRSGFWGGREGIEAQWAALHDEVPAEDRERIMEAMRALARRK